MIIQKQRNQLAKCVWAGIVWQPQRLTNSLPLVIDVHRITQHAYTWTNPTEEPPVTEALEQVLAAVSDDLK